MTDAILDFIQWLLNSIWIFLEEFLKALVNGLDIILPSTPESFTLSALLLGYFEVDNLFQYFIIQIFQGIQGILLLIIIYKFIKLLPFV